MNYFQYFILGILLFSCKKEDAYTEIHFYYGKVNYSQEIQYNNSQLDEYTNNTFNAKVVVYREGDSLNVFFRDRTHPIYYPTNAIGTSVCDVQTHSLYLPSTLLCFAQTTQDSMRFNAIRFGHFSGISSSPKYIEETYDFSGVLR
jgi:hypothetical protein